jgi:hypothetical protein
MERVVLNSLPALPLSVWYVRLRDGQPSSSELQRMRSNSQAFRA